MLQCFNAYVQVFSHIRNSLAAIQFDLLPDDLVSRFSCTKAHSTIHFT